MKGWSCIYCLIVVLLSALESFGQQKFFPYQLSKADYAWVSVGAITYGVGYYLGNQITSLSSTDIQSLNANTINSFDRSAISKWNTSLDSYGTIGKYGLFLAPSLMLLPAVKNKHWKDGFTYGMMYFEMALLTTGITELTKSLIQRTRPFLYNTSLSIDDRQGYAKDYGEKDSFVSGHTSLAFASAVFLSKSYTDIYGKSIWSKVIWGTSLSLASLTAYSRYESGQHFPTDIIAGAAIGSLIGYAIPLLHSKEDSKLGMVMSPNQIYISYRFN